jgi:hypothetical protein
MAMTRCCDWGINDSPSLKAWGKLEHASAVDLANERGHALTGKWIQWDEKVDLQPDEFLVVAAEDMARNRRVFYRTKLIEGGAKHCREIPQDEINTVINAAIEADRVPAVAGPKVKDSKLYGYALYCWLRWSGFAAAAPTARTVNDVNREIEEVERRLEELKAERESLQSREIDF